MKDTHWAIDIGALKLSKRLAKQLKCPLIHAKYSRLLVDVNRSYYSESVIRKKCGSKIVELNKNVDIEKKMEIFSKYHVSYYTGMRDMLNNFNHKIAFSIHSFTKVYDTAHGEETRDLEIGILNLHHRNQAEYMEQKLKEKGYIVKINEPYNAHLFEGQCENSLTRFGNKTLDNFSFDFKNHPGLGLLEFRNDILQDDEKFEKLVVDLTDVFENIFEIENKFECCKYEVEICPQIKLKEDFETRNCVVKMYENLKIEDGEQPRIGFFAPYASGLLPQGYTWPESDIENLVKKNFHYDVKMKELADSLAQHFSVVSIYPKFSFMLVDPTKILTNQKKIPSEISIIENFCEMKKIEIFLNKNLPGEEFQNRIKNFEIEFQKGLVSLSVDKEIQPDYWISLRVFKQAYCKNLKKKQEPDFIITTTDNLNFGLRFQYYLSRVTERDLHIVFNEGICAFGDYDFTSHALSKTRIGDFQGVLTVYVREDLILEEFEFVDGLLKEVVKRVCYEQHAILEAQNKLVR